MGLMRVLADLKQSIRGHRNSERLVVRLAVELTSIAYGCLSAPAKFCVNGPYRSAVLLRLFSSQRVHQTTVVTRMDRYPKIFAVCRDHFIGKTDLRILSYGCATGEEVLTLRNYFPSAVIVGAEINRHSLSMARKHKVDDRIVFLEPENGKIRGMGPFDIVFCLAVLQRTPTRVIAKRIMNLKGIYPFEKFDEKVTELDSWLKTGGLLVIYHSQYLLSDASVASKYSPLDAAKDLCTPGPFFDRNSIRRSDAPEGRSVFIKRRE